MNKGIERAEGDVIGIINSDDWYEPDALEIISKTIQGQKISGEFVIHGLMNPYSESDNRYVFTNGCNSNFLEKGDMIPHPTCFISKSTYVTLGSYDTRYFIAADLDRMLHFYNSKVVQFINIHKVIANFRAGGISTKEENSKRIQAEHAVVCKQYGITPRGVSEYKTLLRIQVASFVLKVIARAKG